MDLLSEINLLAALLIPVTLRSLLYWNPSMGLWGHGAFDNDAALDWAMDLAKSKNPLTELRRCLEAADAGSLDTDTADVAWAAAAFLAQSLNGSLATLPDELLSLTVTLPRASLLELLPLAEQALASITKPGSESWQLWKEAGDYEYSAWIRAIQRTARELKTAQASVANREKPLSRAEVCRNDLTSPYGAVRVQPL